MDGVVFASSFRGGANAAGALLGDAPLEIPGDGLCGGEKTHLSIRWVIYSFEFIRSI